MDSIWNFLITALMDSNWALALLTLALVIITAWYARSNHKYVKLFEKERKRRVIGEIARSIFSPILTSLSISKEYLEKGYFIILRQDKVRLDLLSSPNYYLKEKVNIHTQNRYSGVYCSAEYLLSFSDEILDKHISKIRELSQEFDEYRNRLEVLLKEIVPVVFSEFRDFCEEIIEEYRKSEQSIKIEKDDDYYRLLSYVIGGTKSLPDGHEWKEFWEKYRTKMLSWILQDPSLREKIDRFNKIKEELINTINKLEEEINNLFKEWRNEYGLTALEMRQYQGYISM
ncbi:hypothetical protein Asulf_01543 [Archaeoglobus sulfaticallidus PM70-1]|uniref:Uncharacterized protein n=1 Tax=Archaeoglobus sulfaticallidus PM70-1 TaxID=387631 RepID=N0BLV6_9EURY|nr:hypothetical protein [Archaeoglobus sulfaticallidus]AGK61521.1 hypothetical protein Asulf_01543 [Archaeoglobus sulfaticallidus PM70-1]